MVRGARCIVMMAAVSENVMWNWRGSGRWDWSRGFLFLTSQSWRGRPRPWLGVPSRPHCNGRVIGRAWRTPDLGRPSGSTSGGQAVILERDSKSAAETVDALRNRVRLLLAEKPDNYRSNSGQQQAVEFGVYLIAGTAVIDRHDKHTYRAV